MLASTSGCGRFTRTKQCRALIAQVNPALDDVLMVTHGASRNSGADYVSAAARYERLAKQLGPMEFSSEQMAKYVAEYASILNGSAQSLRALAAALDADNGIEADRINRDLERLTTREKASVVRMDGWCHTE